MINKTGRVQNVNIIGVEEDFPDQNQNGGHDRDQGGTHFYSLFI